MTGHSATLLTEESIDLVAHLSRILPAALTGRIVQTSGATAAAAGFPAPIGALVEIERQGATPVECEVIGFRDNLTLLYSLGTMAGISRGNRVRLVRTSRTLPVGDELLGRVINAQGVTIDHRPQPLLPIRVPLDRSPPCATHRPRILHALSTGIRAIDSLLTCGRGQRMGIFSGSGVGKSVSLGMMARYSEADVIVIALIGERGREVNEFLHRDLGPLGRQKSVVVVATSDQPALLRVQSAFAATAVAEYFRDQGKDVLLLMDSLTRFAMAQREIGLAAGEPPAARGYPPSVFSALPKLVERAGSSPSGTITAFYSVLVEGDDPSEPISDAVRAVLDGHAMLSRRLAAKGHYPAIDILDSVSRLMPEVTTPEHRHAATVVRTLLGALRDNQDLVSIGAYRAGSNPTLDLALTMQREIDEFVQQPVDQPASADQSRQRLIELVGKCNFGRPSGPGKNLPSPNETEALTLRSTH